MTMSESQTPLVSPPWTPLVDQGQFEVISPFMLDASKSRETNFDITTLETPLFIPLATDNGFRRPSLQGHRRYLSFPLGQQDITQAAPVPMHARTMSCMTTHGLSGLGISLNTEPITPMLSTMATCSSGQVSPVSEECPSTPIKPETDQAQFTTSPSSEGRTTVIKADRPLTAAEMRAEKRKMKRFRLTHQQTRYLMSEFARQAHPDAAHREKLSRAIPGLSARQVQVWFQNRRAKLKRVTFDDRENIVRSRALPDHFDLSTTLKSPFGIAAPQSATMATSTRQAPVRPVVPLAVSIPDSTSSHDVLASPFPCTSVPTSAQTISPSTHDMCRSATIFAPNHFHAVEKTLSASFVLNNSNEQIQPETPAHQFSMTPQACNFASSPCQSEFDLMAPNMTPYGLGFSYGSISGFQASSLQNVPRHKHPGKVLIPRKGTSFQMDMSATPLYSGSQCSPLGIPPGFPIFSAPASVTSFPTYIQ